MLLVARSEQRLAALRADLLVRGAPNVLTLAADLGDVSQHAGVLHFAGSHFPVFDTVLLAYGSMLPPGDHSISAVLQQLENDFVSAAALLGLFANHFEARKTGVLAAITSVAGDRPRRSNYLYGATKGALSLYLQGLRARLHPAGVRVITIKPGPVDTPMTAHMPRSRPFADPERVARRICRALERGAPEVLYAPAYWRFVMAGVRAIPESVFNRLAF
jgi:short-subunit dehydrogenase